MKKVKSLLTLMLAAIVLLVASPFSINQVRCISGGDTKYAVGLVEHCCPINEPKDEATLKQLCCEYEKIQVETEKFSHNSFVQIVAQTTPVKYSARLVSDPIFKIVKSWHYRPPPLLAKTITSLLFQVFRI